MAAYDLPEEIMKKELIVCLCLLVLFLSISAFAEVKVNYFGAPGCSFWIFALGNWQQIDLCDYFVTASMTMDKGWNMMSLPVYPDNDTIQPDFKCVYESVNNGYKWIKTEDIDKTLTGYWVYSPVRQAYSINGWKIDSTQKEFRHGWHMIGGCSKPTRLRPIDGEITIIYDYGPNGFFRLNSGILQPGRGYWIKYKNNYKPGLIGFEIIE